MIILRNKSPGEIIGVCMGIWRLLLGNKNAVKFLIKIPHLTFTVHRLLSDRLLCCNKAILASYPFLGFLLLREGVGILEIDNSLKWVLLNIVSAYFIHVISLSLSRFSDSHALITSSLLFLPIFTQVLSPRILIKMISSGRHNLSFKCCCLQVR